MLACVVPKTASGDVVRARSVMLVLAANALAWFIFRYTYGQEADEMSLQPKSATAVDLIHSK